MPGTRINALSALAEPTQRTDRHFVGRDGELYRQDVSAVRGGLIHRHGIKVVKPTASDFGTWIDQGTATIADVGGALRIESVHAGTTFRFNAALRNLPSGNWDVQIGCRKRSMFKNYLWAGIILRESATGKAESFMWMHRGLMSSAWASATSYQGDRNSQFEFHNQLWFRGRKFSATQWAWYFSLDGSLWCHFDTNTITNFLTTAPDQWGIMIQPVNEGGPNNSCAMDVFHWGEGADIDINAGVPTYGNPGGTGDRTSLITVTTDVALGDGTINNLVDGGFNNDFNDALTPVNAQSGKQITFQFPHPKVITEAKWFQNAAQANGTWKWHGSNDGVTFTDLSATFILDDTTSAAGGTVMGDLSANATAFPYYRIQQTAGTISSAQRWKEIEFKIMSG
jgi:hypothetical protein